MNKDQGLAEACEVIKSTVRHARDALLLWNNRSAATAAAMAHDMMCLGRDITALERIGRRLEAGEIARAQITLPPLDLAALTSAPLAGREDISTSRDHDPGIGVALEAEVSEVPEGVLYDPIDEALHWRKMFHQARAERDYARAMLEPRPTPVDSPERTETARKIARATFGGGVSGVSLDADEWQRCLAAADALSTAPQAASPALREAPKSLSDHPGDMGAVAWRVTPKPGAPVLLKLELTEGDKRYAWRCDALYLHPAPLDPARREEIAVLRETIAGPEAWLERWASHVGACSGGDRCTCGLTLARHEAREARSKADQIIAGKPRDE